MNLAIDIGNTRTKWGLFEGGTLVEASTEKPLPKAERYERAIVCASGKVEKAVVNSIGKTIVWMERGTSVPIDVSEYGTGLGADRIAAAVGACKVSDGVGAIVVDAGTCITIDYVGKKKEGVKRWVFEGGVILPGIAMRYAAMHSYTDKLPMLTFDKKNARVRWGRNTEECMRAGVEEATRYEVWGFTERIAKEKGCGKVVCTGGMGEWMAEVLREGNGMEVEYRPHLVLEGLNEIIEQYGQ